MGPKDPKMKIKKKKKKKRFQVFIQSASVPNFIFKFSRVTQIFRAKRVPPSPKIQ